MARSKKSKPPEPYHEPSAGRFVWLTRAAFVLSAALVLARSTMLETLRNPLEVYPGAEPVPQGPGAATSLILDLLCCMPALLVLARRAIDTTYSLRFAWSFVPLALLGLWTACSVAWAGDKFAAAVGAFHWVAACAFLWAAAQLVRDWLRLRLVAAFCVGLLLVQVGQGLYYRYVEHPDLVAAWKKDKSEILRQRGWEPGSFQARQFENRVLSGEIMGFTSSPNSYAAVLVLLSFVSLGLFIQRAADRDAPASVAVPALAVVLGAVVDVFVGSRTALATPFIGGLILLGVWLLRDRLARHARLAYGAAVAGVVLVGAAVVGHGLHHGTLFHDSLTFRWRYWVAAARMFTHHPLLGVGWENFGPHYLAVRLPVAAEEIKDPHNFVVRFATELGAVGLLLLVLWLLRLGWELTRPRAGVEGAEEVWSTSEAYSARRPPSTLGMIAATAVVGILFNLLCTIDWNQAGAYNALEVMKRLGYACLFVFGAAPSALRSLERQEVDDRPAPRVRYAMLTALALFLLHNLVDFSLFEPGPMFLFAMLCGAALGVQSPGLARGRRWAVLALATACVAWLAVAGVLAAPVAVAEGAADEGDEAVRTARFPLAAAAFERAMSAVPYNADYAFRAARARLFMKRPGEDGSDVLDLIDRAIAADPGRPEYWLLRARSRLNGPAPDAGRVRGDFEQALRLDPNNVDARLEYADVLRRLGDRPAAAEQLRLALHYDDLLSPDEPKRLTPQRVRDVTKQLEEVGGG